MILTHSPNSRMQNILRAFLAAAACAVIAASASGSASAQSQCKATAAISPIDTNSLCANSQWSVTGTETAGPNPGKELSFGAVGPWKGVCAYTYEGCTVQQPEIAIPESDPSASVASVVVNSETVTVTVTGFSPQAVADSTPCKCTDASPQGYNGVTMGAPIPMKNTVYGTC